MRLGRVPRLKLALSSPKRPETVIVGRGKSQDQQQPATGFSFSGRLRRQEGGPWAASNQAKDRGSPRDRVHIPFPLSYKNTYPITTKTPVHNSFPPVTAPRAPPPFPESRPCSQRAGVLTLRCLERKACAHPHVKWPEGLQTAGISTWGQEETPPESLGVDAAVLSPERWLGGVP